MKRKRQDEKPEVEVNVIYQPNPTELEQRRWQQLSDLLFRDPYLLGSKEADQDLKDWFIDLVRSNYGLALDK